MPAQHRTLDLARLRDARSGRASSFDQRGRNQDGWVIAPGQSRVLADLSGPGAITHIFMTQFTRRSMGPGFLDPVETAETAPVIEMHNALGMNWEIVDPDYYRKVLIRITWDNDEQAAVLVPLGDFFGIGHSMPANYQSALFTVSVKPEEELRFGGSAALNCYVPMPFNQRAVVELVNEGDLALTSYFHIDYELYREPLPTDIGYFHARWHRENPCDGWGPELQVNTPESNVPNLDGARNYVVLDLAGEGHYIGCNLSVYHRQGTWWGEGDDMIFIDDDTWPPSLHGTGTEDYLTHAWGMQKNSTLYGGSILHESDVPGYSVGYRLHVVDPIHFSSRIKVTIEHGHANHLSDDWASTAYWYQRGPSPAAHIPPMADRLPTRAVEPSTLDIHTGEPLAPVAGEIAHNKAAQAERMRVHEERMQQRLDARYDLTGQWEAANSTAAQDLRRRFE